MHRRLKNNAKIGIIIFFFSILITAVFAGTMLWFGTQVSQMQHNLGSGVYILSSTEYAEAVSNRGALQMKAESLMGSGRYQTALFKHLLIRLIPASIIFLIVLFVLSVLLWQLLKRLHYNRTVKIAEQLLNSVEEPIFTSEPILAETYEKLKEKLENRLEDFKRLSAYLTHEQKNEVAILRTQMELSGNIDGLEKLDNITNGIDDILTLSENIDTAPQAVVDVTVICAEVFDSYRKAAPNLTFDFNEDDGTEILAKSRWVYRAVANLLDNAVKYGEDKPIFLSVKAKNGSVIVMVKDNGIGIREDKQEMIFGNRYRINELNRDGYGIGLSLVSHVCDLCGGFITVDSEPGKGSVFYLSFPQKPF
ncbi:sensor histidine kinase [Cuneatibacter caecimuris]|uniref:histidine kinase n=1 Tax=Cuneatibacter caecimuris TaxID=1796618 RepID=A0A4Q7PIM9_9FIRM|nr:HAMP domain-containing sensor histidine kinase [Cuneatibacter caecimuris]RZT00482.1 signal transduction histidine kinase [Cuneatibacter caecimuris]